MCVVLYLRRSWSTGGWTATRWSPAAGWPTPSTGTPRRHSMCWTPWNWILTQRSLVMKRLPRSLGLRMIISMEQWAGGRKPSQGYGQCLMSLILLLLLRLRLVMYLPHHLLHSSGCWCYLCIFHLHLNHIFLLEDSSWHEDNEDDGGEHWWEQHHEDHWHAWQLSSSGFLLHWVHLQCLVCHWASHKVRIFNHFNFTTSTWIDIKYRGSCQLLYTWCQVL